MVLKAKKHQEKGLIKVQNIYNAEMGLTNTTLRKLNLYQKPLPIPAFYNTPGTPKNDFLNFNSNEEEFYKKKLIIMMHSRHVWVKPKMISNDKFDQMES